MMAEKNEFVFVKGRRTCPRNLRSESQRGWPSRSNAALWCDGTLLEV